MDSIKFHKDLINIFE